MIYLLRHGEIGNGSRKRFIGQTDCGLSATGRLQAEGWGGFFERVNLRLVLCSDLQRSAETARIIVGQKTDLVCIDNRLREIDLGDWDGRDMTEIKSKYPEQWEKRGQDLAGYRPPRGESFADLARRVVPVLEEPGAMPHQDVLIVGHAGVNRVLLCHILEMPLQNLFRLGQDYACLNIVHKKGTHYRVQSLNT
ncbi:MAG: histidine phosphatase family protein [Desulfohalobiaceae bacterium]|nr:histidine phosphatase family protein [Desulfohalobiaceae bacterium]